MDLYIYNGTKQPLGIMEQIKESDGALLVSVIPPGHQLMLEVPDDLERRKVVLAHHERYGIVPLDRIDFDDTFAGTCYSEKPVQIGGKEAPIVI